MVELSLYPVTPVGIGIASTVAISVNASPSALISESDKMTLAAPESIPSRHWSGLHLLP